MVAIFVTVEVFWTLTVFVVLGVEAVMVVWWTPKQLHALEYAAIEAHADAYLGVVCVAVTVELVRTGARLSKILTASRCSSHLFDAIAVSVILVVATVVLVVVFIEVTLTVSVTVLYDQISTFPPLDTTTAYLVDGVTVTLKRLSQSAVLDRDGAPLTAGFHISAAGFQYVTYRRTS